MYVRSRVAPKTCHFPNGKHGNYLFEKIHDVTKRCTKSIQKRASENLSGVGKTTVVCKSIFQVLGTVPAICANHGRQVADLHERNGKRLPPNAIVMLQYYACESPT